ncbi:UNVERIFIED_CONTAM: hypothetical protein Sangu_2803800 [Sesamum angustifolium]|uniref:Uncharacterized protein n=1 Tax=Sesamum angustifolium TaxID=2727405 RepID=A0AAW2ITE2_9LAMI
MDWKWVRTTYKSDGMTPGEEGSESQPSGMLEMIWREAIELVVMQQYNWENDANEGVEEGLPDRVMRVLL